MSKTKSALGYHEKNISANNSLDALYYIGDNITNALDLTYENLDSKTKNEISAFDSSSVSGYDSLYTADGNNIVEIISGMTFHARQQGDSSNVASDFSIQSTRKPGEKILVLPVEKGSKYGTWTLTQGHWDGNNPAPYKDTAELSKRRLPQSVLTKAA